MKKLLRFIAAIFIAAAGAGIIYFAINGLFVSLEYTQAAGCIGLIGLGIALLFVAWEIFRGNSVKDIIDIIVIGLLP